MQNVSLVSALIKQFIRENDSCNVNDIYECIDFFCNLTISEFHALAFLAIEDMVYNCKAKELNFSDDNYDEVEVEVETDSGRKYVFFVQLNFGKHRSSLGCWILEKERGFQDVDFDDYPEVDFEKVILAAEKFYREKVKIESTQYRLEDENLFIFIVEEDEVCFVAAENSNYLNKDASPYEYEYRDIIAYFDTKEEALSYLASEYK